MRISDWSSDVCSSDLDLVAGEDHRDGDHRDRGDVEDVVDVREELADRAVLANGILRPGRRGQQREHGDERRFPDFRPRRSGLVDEVVLLHGIFHCWSLSWVVWKTSNSVHAVACAWVLLENECRISVGLRIVHGRRGNRSEEHTSELQSLMRISYAVFCLKK